MSQTWCICIQFGEFSVSLQEKKWWVSPVNMIASAFLRVAVRSPGVLCTWLNGVAQWIFYISNKGMKDVKSIPIDVETARELNPEFVEMLTDLNRTVNEEATGK